MEHSDSSREKTWYIRILGSSAGIRLRWWLSGAVAFLSDLQVPVFLRPILWRFLGGVFGVRSEEVEKPLQEYSSFDAFFTRKLRLGARPVGRTDYIHPADAEITASHPIQSDQLIQAKGSFYSLEKFLNDPQALQKYDQGWALTYYLSPKDYHRVHCPVEG
ncbi:MAG: phosphatidylserine decarboxylase, partial [Bdellovibrio sp.]